MSQAAFVAPVALPRTTAAPVSRATTARPFATGARVRRSAARMAASPAADGEASASDASVLNPPEGDKDIYAPFWAHAQSVLETRLAGDLLPYTIPAGFKQKEEIVGKGKRAGPVRTTSYAYATSKLRQIRTAHVQGGKSLQVLNFVMMPDMRYDLPFFGADLVTLPGGHLIALDMQPLFHSPEYVARFSTPVQETFERHRKNLPWGGDFPDEAARFFSPSFLWSRPSEDEVVQTHVFEAFKDYLNHYLDFVEQAEPITDEKRLAEVRDSQIAYLRYRAEKDPARGMFLRFYGEEWTEEYIHGFLFDLERKIEAGEYQPPI